MIPSAVVVHAGSFTDSLARARALRRSFADTLTVLDPTVPDVDDFARSLSGVRPTDPVFVFHLVDDLEPLVQASGFEAVLASQVDAIGDALHLRIPSLNQRHWIVLRSGHRIGEAERRLIGVATQFDRVRGSVLVTSSTKSSVEHSDDEISAFVGDLLHLLATTELEGELADVEHQAWAVNAASVALRFESIEQAALKVVADDLSSLLANEARDEGFAEGQRWINSVGWCPPDRPGVRDAERELLLAGPAGTSLDRSAAARLRGLERYLDEVDPGMWPAVISNEIDAVSAPRSLTELGGLSPLELSLEQLSRTGDQRASDMAQAFEGTVRARLASRMNITTTEGFCEGAASALRDGTTRLRSEETAEESVDLGEFDEQLRKAVRWLPHGVSTVVRGLLLTALVLVLAYAYAPVSWALARLLAKATPALGEDLTANARLWARLTAAGCAGFVWLWWEAKWRRAIRLRRQYIRAAERRIQELVESHLRNVRVAMLNGLIRAAIAVDASSALTWLVALRTATAGLAELAAAPVVELDGLGRSRFATTLPPAEYSAFQARDFTPEEVDLARQLLVEGLARSAFDALSEEVARGLRERMQAAFGHKAKDALHAAELLEPAFETLAHDLTPQIDHDLHVGGSHAVCYFVSGSELERLAEGLRRSSNVDRTLGSADPLFAATVWARRIDPTGFRGAP